MKYFTDIHGPKRINYDNSGDPLTFPLAPSSVPVPVLLSLSNPLLYDQIPAKVTASDGLYV